LVALLSGCAGNRADLTIRSDAGQAAYAQGFSKAYITGNHNGEYDLVLIQDPPAAASNASAHKAWPLQWPGSGSDSNKPLQPLDTADLRQIVHVHVFWQAQGGSVARDGVVTNAAIDWYVIAHDQSDRPDMLHYEGAGYVLLDEGNKTTSVEIRDGTMKQTQVTSGLKDPLGPAKLHGTIKAQRNSQIVRDTLADLKAQTAGARTTVSQIR
jgi:hypothetical protein